MTLLNKLIIIKTSGAYNQFTPLENSVLKILADARVDEFFINEQFRIYTVGCIFFMNQFDHNISFQISGIVYFHQTHVALEWTLSFFIQEKNIFIFRCIIVFIEQIKGRLVGFIFSVIDV